MLWTRRDFVKIGFGSLGVLTFPRWARAEFGRTPELDPHFFLQINVAGGMDNSYLFDARLLEMTAAGKIQNYNGKDPILYTPPGGGRCYRTALTDNLVNRFGDRFSILNGVLMSTTFDGHDQNTNFLFAGDPTGGESFIPHLNQGTLPATQLDAVQAGELFASLTNTGSTVPLTASAAKGLINRLQQLTPIAQGDPLTAFIRQRFVANSRGDGALSQAARALVNGYDGAPELVESLKKAKLPDPPNDPTTFDLDEFPVLVTELFRNQICRSAMLVIDNSLQDFDAHAPQSAQAQPKTFASLLDRIVTIFQALKDIRYDDQRSFWDVTTVMITSEFGRTLRQEGVDIHSTGTNHNPLNNSVLIGGKGIKPGMVIGASDQVSKDPGEALSGAHLAFDPQKVKAMGRPFDFHSMQPRSDLPKTYSAADYLQIASVANTVYSLFGVDPKRYRKLERNSLVAAPVLTTLLS